MKTDFLSAVRDLCVAMISFFGDIVPTPREVANIFFDSGVWVIKFCALVVPAFLVLTIAFVATISHRKRKVSRPLR